MTRRLIGNLDCEGDFAAGLAEERGEKAGSRFALPGRIEERISALATLLRAFAREGDELWTPRPVAAERLAAADGLPEVRLASGPLDRLPPATAVLAWGETEAVRRDRERASEPGSVARAGPAAAVPSPRPGPLADMLWMLAAPDPRAAARANHRSLALGLSRSLGVELPGAEIVRSIAELERHLHAGAAAAAPGERWVLKAPLSAAGRSRLRGEGREIPAPSRSRAERLLALHGELLFEPWMDRIADFGFLAIVEDEGETLLGAHRLLAGEGGSFRGIELARHGGEGWLDAAEAERLHAAARAAAARLRETGYRGPFGIDCWRYRDQSGETRFHPLGEINARLTFGFVARAIFERTAKRAERVSLLLGTGEELARAQATGAAAAALLLPGAADPTAAWLEHL